MQNVFGLCMVVLVQFLCLYKGGEAQTPIEVKWGVADASAIVGKIFRMHIPSDAFSGKVLKYEVHSQDKDSLPDWLEFDNADNVLLGLPTKADVGPTTLELVAVGETNKARYVFAIYVRDDPSHTHGATLNFRSTKGPGPDIVRCKRDEPETIATIILDTEIDRSSAKERLALAKKFLGHMDLREEMIKIIPVGGSPLVDNNALVSGTGDCLSAKTKGTFISWPVGCRQVKESHFPVLQRLDDDSSSGKMAEAIGYPVIGWHVTNSHLHAPKRRRRQVIATATPVMTPTMPQSTKESKPEDTMTREVVTMTSAVVTPTKTSQTMEKTDEPVMPKPTPKPDKPDVKEPGVMDPKCEEKDSLKVKTKIPRQKYMVGDIIDYVIPAETFEDCQTGGTRGLKLVLFINKTTEIPKNFFLQFKQDEQKIIGLPMAEDAATYQFNLVARKPENVISNVAFTMVIKSGKGKKKKINHELSVSIDYDYDEFMSNVETRTKLASNIASVYGDSDASKLTITTMKRGSVIYGWSNNSLTDAKGCPADAINALSGQLVNEDGSLTENAIKKLDPFWLSQATAQPVGDCVGNNDFRLVESKVRVKPPTDTTRKPDDGDEDKSVEKVTDGLGPEDSSKKPADETTEKVAKGSRGGDGGDDVLITTVIPAVVIVIVLIIALIIACVLYRKKRKGKMNVEEQNTFINKGTPVIFPNELGEKANELNKPLLVEGSPAPPEYQRGKSESPGPQGAGQFRSGQNGAGAPDDTITELTERPYDPPPPVATISNNKQPRPNQQQPFREQPQILP